MLLAISAILRAGINYLIGTIGSIIRHQRRQTWFECGIWSILNTGINKRYNPGKTKCPPDKPNNPKKYNILVIVLISSASPVYVSPKDSQPYFARAKVRGDGGSFSWTHFDRRVKSSQSCRCAISLNHCSKVSECAQFHSLRHLVSYMCKSPSKCTQCQSLCAPRQRLVSRLAQGSGFFVRKDGPWII